MSEAVSYTHLYKTGGLSLLQVLTGVDDLGDMLNRLFYLSLIHI